jgi:hypothetical protein
VEERTTGVGIDKNDEVFTLTNQLKISNKCVSRINFTFGSLFQSKSEQMILIVIFIVSVIKITIVLFIIFYVYHLQMENADKDYVFLGLWFFNFWILILEKCIFMNMERNFK